MDPATLVVSLLILVLQVITLAVILGDRKKRASQPQPAARDDDRTRDRRDFRDRFPRKPGQQPTGNQWEQKNRRPQEPSAPAPAPAPAAPIDKSLRDINLRLKSAERDQEKARRETRGPMSETSSMRPRDRHRGPGRGDRDRGDRRDRRDGRDRDMQRPALPRETGSAPQVPSAAAPAQSEIEKQDFRDRNRPIRPVAAPAEVIPASKEPVENPQQTQEELESIEHGRKFMVKRRMLKNGEEETSPETGLAPVSETDATEPSPSVSQHEEEEEQKQGTAYGRR